MTAARTYRLNPPDRTGWLLGLNPAQLATLTAATALSVAATASGMSPVVGLGGITVGGTLAFARVAGVPLIDAAPTLLRRIGVRRRASWFAPVPLVGTARPTALPPPLHGQRLLSVDAATVGFAERLAPIGVVHDRRTGTVAAVLRVSGTGFALRDPSEQDYLVQHWGDALAGFCQERSAVIEVRWTEWAAPDGTADHAHWISDHTAIDADDTIRDSYAHLLECVAALSATHDLLVTVVARVGRSTGDDHPRHGLAAAIETLLGEVRLFTDRIAMARLRVSGPLAPAEINRAVRRRLDPWQPLPDTSLAALTGLDGTDHLAGPLATRVQWKYWMVDGAYHRALYAAEWSRTDVHAGWLQLLLHHSDAPRCVTLAYQPIAPSASRRAISRQAAKIESDADTRAAKGFRVGADHRRSHTAVLERESELVAGFGELAFAGVITVAGRDLDELDRATAGIVNTAAALGIDLRPLHGRHDVATAVGLPVARGLVPKGWL